MRDYADLPAIGDSHTYTDGDTICPADGYTQPHTHDPADRFAHALGYSQSVVIADSNLYAAISDPDPEC